MKDLTGKKVLMVIARNKFRDEEYLEPRKVLEAAGVIITVASSSLNTAEGVLGLNVKPDVLIGDVKEGDYDGIVFVGGGGASEYFDNPVAHKLARNFFEHGKLTSAICIAPATLANAGVLKDKRATAFPSSEGALNTHGAIVIKDDVVTDGKIVTAVGPSAAKKFGEKLVDVISS
ncbi:MAG: DJ-1/PfpI family protein [Nitrospirae bacterium]|nr:DJ-1/PfpI family protein [Nitrospirota bacterium]NTW66976.1 DJ-1/PfpI family protein [Nitrospirota bacterium]